MGKIVAKNRYLLRQLIENIDDNVFFKDREHKFIMINEANARWFGFDDPNDAVGKSDFDLFDAEFAQQAFDDEEVIMTTGKGMKRDAEKTIHNGKVVWGSVSKVPIRDEEGEICGIMGIGRDITQLKQREAELEAAHGQMAQDLRVAASLQKAFLPNNYPRICGGDGLLPVQFNHYYEACDELGGDFCSIQQISDTKVGLLICDVMGHGVRAALVTASIKAIEGELSRSPHSATDFLSKMNRRLFSLLQNADTLIFATACYAILDVKSCMLELSVAGHSLPVRLHTKEGDAELMSIPKAHRGPALGLHPDYTYQGSETQYCPGDAMVMFTDGLLEATDIADQEFGIEHVLDAVSDCKSSNVEQIIQSIVERLRKFRGDDRLDDDICLMGFTVGEPSQSS